MSTSCAASSFLLIRPMLERHVGDAAFYWQQRYPSAHSPLLDWQALRHFDRLLEAHLDGIRTAGDAGWHLALQALERWRGAGEVFVCAVLALARDREAWLQAVTDAVRRDPVWLTPGLVSALSWLPPGLAFDYIERWSHPEATEDKIGYEDMRDYGLDSIKDVFPESGCDRKCLRAQLDAYYENICKDIDMPAAAGVGGKTDINDRGSR